MAGKARNSAPRRALTRRRESHPCRRQPPAPRAWERAPTRGSDRCAQGEEEQRESGEEGGDAAGDHGRSEGGVDEKVDARHGQTQHARAHQTQHVAQGGAAPVRQGAQLRAESAQAGQLDQQVQQGAEHGAPGQAMDVGVAHLGGTGIRRQGRGDQQGADDQADAVHADGQRGQQEALVRVQQTHQQAADAEDQRASASWRASGRWSVPAVPAVTCGASK